MERELDIFRLIKNVLKKWKLLLLALIISLIVGYIAGNYVIKPVYKSEAKVYIRGTSSLSASLSDLQLGTYLSNDYEVILKSQPILAKTIKNLSLNMTEEKLAKKLTIETIQDTRIIRIICKTNDPKLSKEIVKDVMTYGIDTIKEIDAKVPYVVEQPLIETDPVSLSPLKITLLSGVAGTVLAAALIALYQIFNVTIKEDEDLEDLGLTVLGHVYEDENIKTTKIVEKKEHESEE